MVTANEIEEDLTPKQEAALKRLRATAAPPAPVLSPDLLEDPPLWVRFLPQGAVVAAALLLSSLLWPFLKAPAIWQGSLPLYSGADVELMAGGSQAIQLPESRGSLLLYGPASLKLDRLSRHLVSDRMEGKLTLSSGELLLDLSSKAPKAIWIQTPLLLARVTGTQLLIGHRPEQGTRLYLWEGTVQVKSAHSGWQPLSPGMVLSVSPEGLLQKKSIQPEASLDPQLPASRTAAPVSESSELRRLLWYEED